MKKFIEKESFVASDGRVVELFLLCEEDFSQVKNFYLAEIEKLENKANFYPYKDSEMLSILSGEGIFLGGFCGGELVGLCAVDFDASYQISVKEANKNFAGFPMSDELFEFSGLFVKEGFRKVGIAEKMSEILLEKAVAEKPKARFFSVVLEDNVPSLKNFFSMGFELCGWWQLDEEFKFVYLVSPVERSEMVLEKPSVENVGSVEKCGEIKIDFCEVREYLEKGYVFGGVEDGKLASKL